MSCGERNKKAIINRMHWSRGAEMVGRERWLEIRRQHFEERESISAIARRMQLDRKTVRRCIQDQKWQPYRRGPKADTLLAEHTHWLRRRAPQVRYSARILHQELNLKRGYRGSYETVRFWFR